MATARQRSEWARVGALVAWIGPSVWAKKPIRPERVIPPEFRPPQPQAPELTPEERAAEAKRGWKLLNSYLGGGKKPKGKKG